MKTSDILTKKIIILILFYFYLFSQSNGKFVITPNKIILNSSNNCLFKINRKIIKIQDKI